MGRRVRFVAGFAAVVMVSVALVTAAGCGPKEKPNPNLRRAHWTDVMADPAGTAVAAQAVMGEQNFRDVRVEWTNIEGTVTGKTLEGTPVTVMIEKETNRSSQIRVIFGFIDNPEFAEQIAAKVRTPAATQPAAETP